MAAEADKVGCHTLPPVIITASTYNLPHPPLLFFLLNFSLSLFLYLLLVVRFCFCFLVFLMERAVAVHGGGGSSGGSVASTVSREEVLMAEGQCSNSNMALCSHEVSSYPDEAGLELGLGLGLGVSRVGALNKQQGPRILTAKDLPSMGLRALKPSPPSASSSSSTSLGGGEADLHGFSSAGTKRAAETSPTRISQVVGWPPIRASRINSLSNQAKAVASGEVDFEIGKNRGQGVRCTANDTNKADHNDNGHIRGSLFVKVNMDGIGIGRKVDLNAHSSYESLGLTLEEMFTIPTRSDTLSKCDLNSNAKRPSKLLDGLSDFVLTYEDKDGDWMLVGDVPWGLFLSTVKRLKIMKTSEAKGLNT